MHAAELGVTGMSARRPLDAMIRRPSAGIAALLMFSKQDRWRKSISDGERIETGGVVVSIWRYCRRVPDRIAE